MAVKKAAESEEAGYLGIGSPEKEYDQALQDIRFFMEYRVKIFGFCVTVNGASLALSMSQHEGRDIWLWGFSLAVTIACLLAELRSIELADQYRAVVKRLETRLGFSMVTEIEIYARSHGISLRFTFRLLYGLFSLIWVGRIFEKVMEALG
ncbi:MAG TPA: hypothetical protein VGR07_13650 [Thermoanaerobaculia bacterium]|jgi:hypothetical protein|nr:hypothetical protein [Thermoanaerobaculia bacterium]